MTAVDVAQLRDAVARELHAQLALRGEVIRLVDVPEVAYIVAVQLTRRELGWDPDQPPRPGSVERTLAFIEYVQRRVT